MVAPRYSTIGEANIHGRATFCVALVRTVRWSWVHDERKYIYISCSEPCWWLFLHEPERYANRKDVAKRGKE